MSDGRTKTDRTFEELRWVRLNERPASASRLLRDAMGEAGTCVTRAAVGLGMSEAYMRKLRDGGAQLDLRDLIGMAEHEPQLYGAILRRLAGLSGHTLVEQDAGDGPSDRFSRLAGLAKETAEAVSAVADDATRSTPETRRRSRIELQEAAAHIHAELARIDREDHSYSTAVRSVVSTRRGEA